jgi:hypothetical protein
MDPLGTKLLMMPVVASTFRITEFELSAGQSTVIVTMQWDEFGALSKKPKQPHCQIICVMKEEETWSALACRLCKKHA